MARSFNRRQAVKTMIAASVATAMPKAMLGRGKSSNAASPPVEVQITSISPHTLRLQLLPIRGDEPEHLAAAARGHAGLERFGFSLEPFAKTRLQQPRTRQANNCGPPDPHYCRARDT